MIGRGGGDGKTGGGRTVAWGREALGGSPPRVQVQPGGGARSLGGFGRLDARGAWMPLLELRGEGAAGERSSAWNTWGLDSEAEPGPLGPLEECRLRDGRG